MKNIKRNFVLFSIVLFLGTLLFVSCPSNVKKEEPKMLTLHYNGSGLRGYYYLDGKWYSDKTCKNVMTDLNIKNPSPSKIVTIKVDGVYSDAKDVPSNDQKTLKIGDNAIPFGFVKYTEGSSEENYFKNGFKLPADGITKDVTLTAHYNEDPQKWYLPRLTKNNAGYVFKGYTSVAGEEISLENIGTPITVEVGRSITYKAEWEVSYNTLTLINDDVETTYYNIGDEWFSDSDCKNKISTLTLTSPSPKTAKVTLNLNNGTIKSETNSEQLQNGVNTVNFDFIKYTAKDSQIDYFKDGLKLPKSGITEDVVLYASFVETVTRKLPSLEKNNYKFNGYRINGEIVQAESEITLKVGDNKTYTAEWSNLGATKLTLNYGSVSKSYYYRDKSWFSNSLCTPTSKIDDLTLVAPESKKVTINVDFDGGTSDTTSDEKYLSNNEGGNIFEWKFIRFTQNGSDEDYFAATGLKLPENGITEDTELTAVYEDAPFERYFPTLTKSGYKLDVFKDNFGNTAKANNKITISSDDNDRTYTALWLRNDAYRLTLTYSGGEDTYYYAGNAWFSDPECENKLEDLTIAPPSPRTFSYTVDFGGGTPKDGNDEEHNYFIDGYNEFTFNFVSYNNPNVIIEENGVLSLSENGIAENTDLYAEYKDTRYGQEEVLRLLPHLTKDGYTLRNYKSTCVNPPYEFDPASVPKFWVHPLHSANVNFTAQWDKKTYNTLTIGEDKYYYGSDKAWYNKVSDDDFILDTNKIADDFTLTAPVPLTATINVDFGIGETEQSDENTYFKSGENTFSWTFEKYVVKETSADSGITKDSLNLPKNGITTDTELVPEYDSTTISRSLPVLSKDGYTFKGYSLRGVPGVIGTETPIVVKANDNLTYTAIIDKKTYKSLTLNIPSSIDEDLKTQTLYYGSDGVWYSAISEGDFILNVNKAEGKFKLPESPTWTVTFANNTSSGITDDKVTLPNKIEVKPSLEVTKPNIIDAATGNANGRELVARETTVTGSYQDTPIGDKAKDAKAVSNDPNYEFTSWVLSTGLTISDLPAHKISGNTTIYATWDKVSEYKRLTATDDEKTYTVFYNKTDNKWYRSDASGEKPSSTTTTTITTPSPKSKTYNVTLDYADNVNDPKVDKTNESSFLGYGVAGDNGVLIDPNGTLPTDGIENPMSLVSKWSTVEYDEPEVPSRDGYKFVEWQKDGKKYDFSTPVTEDIVLTAKWEVKTYKTLTLTIPSQNYTRSLYYGSDEVWYKDVSDDGLLLEANIDPNNGQFDDIPSAPEWTVTFENDKSIGITDDDVTLTSSIVITPSLSLEKAGIINASNGVVESVTSLTEGTTTVIGKYPPTQIGEKAKDVVATPKNPNYKFAGWTKDDSPITDLSTLEVSGPTIVKATWTVVSDFEKLTVIDGENTHEAFFNTKDRKWYDADNIQTGNVISTITIPSPNEILYVVTVDLDGGQIESKGNTTLKSVFEGYEAANTSVKVDADGTLPTDGISLPTTLEAKWSQVKYEKPASDPTREDYTFVKWVKVEKDSESDYDFDSYVTSDITIKAKWYVASSLTLTLNADGEDAKIYYFGSNKVWYSDEECKNEIKDLSLSVPTPKKVIFNVDFAGGKADESKTEEAGYFVNGENVIPFNFEGYVKKGTSDVVIAKDNLKLPSKIDENTELDATYESISKSRFLPFLTKESSHSWGYRLNDGLNFYNANDEDRISFSSTTKSGYTFVAQWKDIARTLTLNNNGSKTNYYYENGNWYSNTECTAVVTSVPLPSPLKATIKVNFDGGSTEQLDKNTYFESGENTIEWPFEKYFDETNNKVSVLTKDKLILSSIKDMTDNLEYTAKYDETEKSRLLPVLTKDGYTFGGYKKGDETITSDNITTPIKVNVGDNLSYTAILNKKTYKTLTLNIPSQNYESSLYYGSDNVWYKALGTDNLLLNANKDPNNGKFELPSAPKWTVTFDKGTTPGDADEGDFRVPSPITITPSLDLDVKGIINATTGVIESGASLTEETTTITGSYPEIAIGDKGNDVKGESNDVKYGFDTWTTTDGTPIIDLSAHKVSGPETIKATWKALSNFKVLIAVDGGKEQDKAYYNTIDKKWYNKADLTSGEKTTLSTPSNKTYIVTLNYNDGGKTEDAPIKTEESSFVSYVSKDGSYTYTSSTGFTPITEDTTIYSTWSQVVFNKPSTEPTRDGYVFKGWFKDLSDENAYDFSAEVTSNFTLTAKWDKKTYKTLTLKIGESYSESLYYGSDKTWYSKVENGLILRGNKTEGKFTFPAAPEWQVSFANDTSSGITDALVKLPSAKTVTPDLKLDSEVINLTSGVANGDALTSEITTVTGSYPPTAIGTVADPTSSNENYEFTGWKIGDTAISNLSTHKISGSVNVVATWKDASSFIKLTATEGTNTYSAFYNTKDKKWYDAANIQTGEVIKAITTPAAKTKTYKVTLNYNDGNKTANKVEDTPESSFLGYGEASSSTVLVDANGTLPIDGIKDETTLVEKWSAVTYSQPKTNPEYDGYTFVEWQKGGAKYNFSTPVTENIVLTAKWEAKTYKILTIGSEKYYFGSDNVWYKALGTGNLLLKDNKVADGFTLTAPDPRTATVTLNFGSSDATTTETDESTYFVKGANKFEWAFEKYVVKGTNADSGITKDSLGLPKSGITVDTELVAVYESGTKSRRLPALTRSGYTLTGYNDGTTTVSAGISVSVSANDNKTYTAEWEEVTGEYTITIESYESSGVVLTPIIFSPSGRLLFAEGEEITIVINTTSWRKVECSLDGENLSLDSSDGDDKYYKFKMPAKSVTISCSGFPT